MLVAIDSNTKPADLVVPGSYSLSKPKLEGYWRELAIPKGVRFLAKLAGKKPAGVICEIMNDDGSMARRDDLELFSEKHQIPIVSIEDLITYRLLHDSLVDIIEKRKVETSHGAFDGVWFKNKQDNSVHFALVKGESF